MKKLLTYTVLMCGLCPALTSLAALDFASSTADLLLPPTSISAGATNSVAFTSAGRKGVGEVLVAASSASTNAVVTVTVLTGTNDALFASLTFKADPTNAVYRLPLPCAYLKAQNKLQVSSIGAATSAAAIILAY